MKRHNPLARESKRRKERAQAGVALKVRYQRPMKTRRDSADKSVRDVILARDGFTCLRCGLNYEHDPSKLEVSHFFNRRKGSARYDGRNCDTACIPCHRIWEHEKHEGGEYFTFKVRQLGAEEFEELRRLATNTGLDMVDRGEAREAFRAGLKSRFDTGSEERKAA